MPHRQAFQTVLRADVVHVRRRARTVCRWLVVWLLLIAVGCQPSREFYFLGRGDLTHYQDVATSIDVADMPISPMQDDAAALPPRTLWNHEPTDYWDISLEEAIQLALANSEVMRDLGGRLLTQPTRAMTVYEPTIQETDPRFGVEGALSHFDAQFATSMFWERNDRIINNILLGGGTNTFQQDLGVFESEISKRAATGTQFAVRHNVDYDFNTAPLNLFPSAWNVTFDAEVRHPFLRNGGVLFNRIAGPDALPGFQFRNGVLLARVDQDIRLADFEAGVRNLVNNVENAYWDLYFAYRNLDAKIAARDSALATWRRVQRLRAAGATGGEAANEARASQQYFQFRAEVENALSGMSAGSSQAGLGTRSGTFLGTGGLYAREANLRYLMGLPQNDGRLLRPHDEPTLARVVFDWYEVVAEAHARRVELRQQRWRVKRRELELAAARNFLLPRLDGVARYRWRGFGDDLIDPDSSDLPPFDNAYQSLTDGDLQEWQLGFLFSMPLGFREGHAAVRNAQQKLMRERAVLAEQQRNVTHDLAAALREMHRAYDVTQSNFNRRLRAEVRVEAVRRAVEEAERATVDRLLDAQQDQADAEVDYFRSLVEYNMAIKAVHFEKGSLLDFNDVYLAEGPWPGKAYDDARRLARRAATLPLDYRMQVPGGVSAGPFAQEWEQVPPGDAETVPVGPDGEDYELPSPNASGGQPANPNAPTPPVRWSGAPLPSAGAPTSMASTRPIAPVVRPAASGGASSQAEPLQSADHRPSPVVRPRSTEDKSNVAPAGFSSPVIQAMTRNAASAVSPAVHHVPSSGGADKRKSPSPLLRTQQPAFLNSVDPAASGQTERLPPIKP